MTDLKDLNARLLSAVRAQDARAVRALLARGADPGAADENAVTALAAASFYGDAGIVTALIEKGADVNAKGRQGLTPLMQAVAAARYEATLVLLSRGARVEDASEAGRTALMMVGTVAAALPGNGRADHQRIDLLCVKIARALIEKGAKVNAASRQGESPLLNAAGFGLPRTVHALLSHGARVNHQNRSGDSPLIAAAREPFRQGDYAAAIATLLKHGAKKALRNRQGESALDAARAKKTGDRRIIDLLSP